MTNAAHEFIREIAEGDDPSAKLIASVVIKARAAIAKAEGGAV